MNIVDLSTICFTFLFLVGLIFGVPVGLAISKARKKLPTKDMICPKCGTATIKGEKIRLDRSTGLEMNFAYMILGFGALLFGILGMFVMIPVGINNFPEWVVWVDIAFLVVGLTYIVSYFRKDKSTVHRYTCRTCSHQWSEEIAGMARG